MPHPATTLLVSALAATALAAPAVATAAPLELPLAQAGAIDLPEDAKNYTGFGELFRKQAYLAPDGSAAWLFNRQRSADDARGLGVAAVQLPLFGTSTPRLGIRWGTIGRTTALRPQSYDSTITSTPIAAVGGGSWFIDRTLTPRPARTRLVRFDDRGEAVQRITVPREISPALIVPTSRGLRVLGTKDVKRGKRTESRIVISGPGVRTWALDPYLRSTSTLAAAPLPDGSLLVSGESRASLPQPVLRVSRSGRIGRLADRRAPGATAGTAWNGLVATRLGVAMIESSSTSMPEADLKTAVVIRGARGQVVSRKYLRDTGITLPEVCTRDGAQRVISGLLAGPDGLPVIAVRCQAYHQPPAGSYAYGNYGKAHFLAGLAEDLSARWVQNIGPATDPGTSYSESCAGTHLVNGDQRIWTIGCDGKYTATTVPDLAAAPLGTITSSKRDGKAGAVVRIRCEGTYGSVCSGQAVVTIAGKVNGAVPYVLPARPGKAASTLDRHIPTPTPIEGRFRTDLRPRF